MWSHTEMLNEPLDRYMFSNVTQVLVLAVIARISTLQFARRAPRLHVICVGAGPKL